MNLATAHPAHLQDLLRLEGEFEPKQRWSEQTWREELARPDQFLVVSVDEATEAVRGAAVFRRAGDVVDLDRIVVAAECRGQGLARAMMLAGRTWAVAENADRLLLEVAADNDAAIRFYRAQGFSEIARRHDYYAQGKHALVMELDLERRAG